MSNAPQFIELGYIAGAFGVRGEVRVHLYGDVLDSVLLDQPKCWVKLSARTGKKGDWQALEIAQIKAHGNSLVVRFHAISNRDQAADLQGYTLALPREAFPEQEDEDTFYWVDLIGCEVLYDPDIEAEEDFDDVDDADDFDDADEADALDHDALDADAADFDAAEDASADVIDLDDDAADALDEAALAALQAEAEAMQAASDDPTYHVAVDTHGHLHEYHDADVYDTDVLQSMGFVREVSENGVHAILHVCAKDESGAWRTNAKGRPLDQLIPFVAPIVPFVDVDEGLIITNYPPEVDAEDAS